MNSLSRGFTAAGAGGVIAGLWNVNDEAAIGILQQFYQQLDHAKDPGLALYDAKVQWLQAHTGNATLQLPYFWAGIVYSGRLQPVILERENNHWLYYAAGLLIIIGAGLLVVRQIKRRN
ncbi:CHAT domain-containing protein [Paraflavitalea speifideaquila]|uniref:CHAT domain-containing protein n=1 Tax=Paraflavitalea speifideaquila TaxID=3076558 RepID=UPI0028E8A519|nr:CHAT domain-containing protein [Paraflavitalea speifideiaquila]